MQAAEKDSMLRFLFSRAWAPYALIVIVSYFLYLKTLAFKFTYFDDNNLIIQNFSFLRHPENFLEAFRHDAYLSGPGYFYRPLLTLSFMFDAGLGGSNPFLFHFTNLLIHAFASCLVYVFFKTMDYSKKAALFFGLLFSVHPLLTQAVAWVPGRNDSLLAVFTLVSFISYLEYLRRGVFRSYALHLLFFFAALLAKETAAGLVLVAAAARYLMSKDEPLLHRGRALFLGWLALGGAWVALRLFAAQGMHAVPAGDMLGQFFHTLPAVVQYIGKAVFPLNLTLFPKMYRTTFAYGIAALALLLLLFSFSKRKRGSRVAFGALWFLAFLLPTLVMPGNYFFEHRMYLPIIGIFVVLAETSDAVRFLPLVRRMLPALCLAVLLGFGTIAFVHSDNFMSRLLFWQKVVRDAPDAFRLRVELAKTYLAYGLIPLADQELDTAIEGDPGYAEAHFNKGIIHEYYKRYDKAEQEYLLSLKLSPLFDVSYLYLRLGETYYRQGRLDQAKQAWFKALEANPRNPQTYIHLAVFYFEQREYDRSSFYLHQLELRCGAEEYGDLLQSDDRLAELTKKLARKR